MHPTSHTPCILYCRVSSRKQMTEGDGLRSQEKRCRDYAAMRGYTVLTVFSEGITGGTDQRPAMNEMLAFLEQQAGEVVVIVDDLKRFARDVELHFDLKMAIYKRGGRLESPLFRFEDTPEGKFIETIVAAQAELERNQNKRQVRSRMQARLEQGYWTFPPPPGYKFVSDRVHKRLLALDAPRSDCVLEVLEGFAADRFNSQAEIARFLDAQGFFLPHPPVYTGKLGHVDRILHQVLYAGYLEYKPWDISLRKGQHPALISFDTYLKIQRKLSGSMTNLSRKDAHEDFVLRNYLTCKACGRSLTASWSRGRSQKYPYYHCPQKGCSEYGKCVPREQLEGEFEQLLQSLEVSDTVLDMAKAEAGRVWHVHLSQHGEQSNRREQRLREIEENLKGLADKFVQTRSEIVVRILEQRIEELSQEQAQLSAQEEKDETSVAEFGTAFEQVRDFLRNPYAIWKSGDFATKRLVLRLVFASPLPYDRKTGFGTTELSLPYLISARLVAGNSDLVDLTRESWNRFVEVVIEWSDYLPLQTTHTIITMDEAN